MIPVLLTSLLLLFTAATVQAVPIQVLTRADLGGNDVIDWLALGASGAMVPNPSSVTSKILGLVATVSQPGVGPLQRKDQGASPDWVGNFADGAHLLWNVDGSDSISLSFSAPVFGAGAQVQPTFTGPFNAILRAFDVDDILVASYAGVGLASMTGDDSALFLGLLDSVPSIKRITFSVTTNEPGSGLAVNHVDVLAPTPEPATLVLAAISLGGALIAGRRKGKSA